ncbi:MAG: hypothetical protein ACXV6M_11920 [Ilumatobacteraceae bacterium]
MIGLAARLVIAEKALDRLSAANAPDAAIVKAQRQWFMLGALGPALGDFVPHEPPAGFGAPGRSPYYSAWKSVLQIAVGDPSQNPPLPGAVPTLRTLLQTLTQLTQLVQAHDFDGVVALRDSGALDAVQTANTNLALILQDFANPANLQQVGNSIGSGSRPRIDNPMSQAPPNSWTGRDYLHWKQTGEFAARLLHDARASHDDRFIAYALGWQVAFASLVCGSDFLASIVGSVYRTHWWRTRWIANFVDAWVWGFYRRGAAADDDYDLWPSLCNARLHEWVQLDATMDPEAIAADVVADTNIPAILPSPFTDYWINAWRAVYGPHDPSVATVPLFTADRLQVAYAMTWLILWFQTSGDVIGCNPDPGAPPSACGSDPQPPDWDDPTRNNPMTNQPFTPPTPDAHQDPDVGEVVCGVILGLLGLVATAFGGGAVGIPAIAGGIALAIDGEKQLNWDELECQLYWLSVYVFNGLGALHKLTVLGGFQPPYAPELAAVNEKVSFNGLSFTFVTAAEQTCRSTGSSGPRQVWNGNLLDWVAAPTTTPAEDPVQHLWSGEMWPSAIVDDEQANPVSAAVVSQPGAFDAGVEASFGPAVPNAMRLMTDPPDVLPNWNLDGDRGHGWLTWELHAPYSVPVNAFPES